MSKKTKPIKKKARLVKPKKTYSIGPMFVWRDIRDYLEKKHKIDLHDVKDKHSKNGADREYCNFWHWMIEDSNIHNGCTFNIPLVDRENKEVKDWIRMILMWIWEDFGNGKDEDLEVWVDW